MKNKPKQEPSSREGKILETCLVWGFPSVVILAIASLISICVDRLFEQTFITIIAFFVSALLVYPKIRKAMT